MVSSHRLRGVDCHVDRVILTFVAVGELILHLAEDIKRTLLKADDSTKYTAARSEERSYLSWK